MLFTYRWTWPSSGRMFVEVWVTIVAPVSLSTTCTVVPFTVVFATGCRISTFAGDGGRGPRLPDGAAGELPALPPHAATRSATATFATSPERAWRKRRGVMV